MLAAAPAWFADNLTPIAGGTLLVLTLLVVRMVQKAAVRLALLVLIAAVAAFAYGYRTELKACATTCECRVAGQDITIPGCDFKPS